MLLKRGLLNGFRQRKGRGASASEWRLHRKERTMNEAALPLPRHLLFPPSHLLLLFFLLQGQNSWGMPTEGENLLQIEPKWAVVSVGGSIQLRCSVTCPNNGAMVQWKGLDTSLGHVSSEPGLSILTIPEATVSMGGSKACIGTCQGSTYQDRVELKVYAFPDKMEVAPSTLVPGQSANLTCSVREVFPRESLTFSWYQGNRKLQGLKFLEKDVDPEKEAETGEELEVFRVTEHWFLPKGLVTLGPEIRCLVEMVLDHQVLNHSRSILVTPRMASPEPSTSLSTETTVGRVLFSSETPTVKESYFNLPDTTTSSLTLGPESSPSSTSKSSSDYPCFPQIILSQGLGDDGGTVELTCQATCDSGASSVQWSQIPGRLEDYQRREAGTQVTLIIPHPGPQHLGLYQCQQVPGGQKASLFLNKENLPDMDNLGNSAALWTGGYMLGLILVALVSNRLWRWLRAKDSCSPQIFNQP